MKNCMSTLFSNYLMTIDQIFLEGVGQRFCETLSNHFPIRIFLVYTYEILHEELQQLINQYHFYLFEVCFPLYQIIQSYTYYKITTQQRNSYKSNLYFIRLKINFIISMNLDNLTYISCPRGHSGEHLDLVCLNQYCYANPLCCKRCVEEFHQGHIINSLKNFLLYANQIAQKAKTQNDGQNSNSKIFDSQVFYNVINQNMIQIMAQFQQLRDSIIATLQQMQENLKAYNQQLQNSLITKNHKEESSSSQILTSIGNILTRSNLNSTSSSIQRILVQLSKVGQNGIMKKVQNKPQSTINLINQSILQIHQIVTGRLSQIRNALTNSSNFLFQSTLNIGFMWDRQLYSFSQVHHHESIKIIDNSYAKTYLDDTYQMTLLQPEIQYGEKTKAFRFRIKKLTSNWMAVGICHLKTAQQNDFQFKCAKLGHGGYMISANAGTWSTINADFNNKVKAFKFKQGDIITCIVNNALQSIFFVKQISVSQSFNNSQRQIYELPFVPIPDNPLYPCAVLFYEGNQVQYIPVTNLSYLPKYQYLFAENVKHSDIRLINNRMAKIKDGSDNGYKACLLNKSLQDQIFPYKKFSFRIVRCAYDWIGVGMCHIKTAFQNDFEFDHKNIGHGYYLASSNGGSWSNIDSKLNNVVKCFKFGQGDVIQCTVQFGQSKKSLNNQIIFKKGSERYAIPFQGIQGDNLYPCVILYYVGDEVSILPQF